VSNNCYYRGVDWIDGIREILLKYLLAIAKLSYDLPSAINPSAKYIFFLHGRIVGVDRSKAFAMGQETEYNIFISIRRRVEGNHVF